MKAAELALGINAAQIKSMQKKVDALERENDAIPLGPHPTPYSEWISVRLDFIQEAIDHMEWIEKGIEEWRQMYVEEARTADKLSATSRIAIFHLKQLTWSPMDPTASAIDTLCNRSNSTPRDSTPSAYPASNSRHGGVPQEFASTTSRSCASFPRAV